MAIAGGLRGAPVELAPCKTIDVPYIADAEIVLEGEILPTGWTWPEGRFGEFTRLMGGLHWNPLVRIKAISIRKDAIYYSLHMPWENTWLAAPTRYAAIRQALKTAGVKVKDINVTLGGCAFWHAVISIKKQPGEGKNAILAALSVMDLKHVVIVDDDIDVNNPMDVEWAIATRVQGDRDIVIVTNARGKPLDPSLPPRRRAWCRRAPRSASTPPFRRACRRSATSASPMPMRTRRRSATMSRARRTRPAKRATRRAVAELAEEILAGDRGEAGLLHRDRRAVREARFPARSRARWAICTRPRSCGRTRKGACASAARNSPPSRSRAEPDAGKHRLWPPG